jgi:hypothetical protein
LAVLPVVLAGTTVIALTAIGTIRERALRKTEIPKSLNPTMAVIASALVVATALSLIAVR